MIALDQVTKTYTLKRKTVVPAVRGVSLNVEKGEFVVITGRSGSGKTTLLNLIAGLTHPTSGRVLLEGAEIWKLADAEQARLRNAKIGFVFQFPSLMPSLTAVENVMLPTLFAAGKGSAEQRGSARERAVQLLGEVGLPDKLWAYPRQLSAGQQQRVVIARSLINRPALLLADEPTSDLDEQTEQEIMAMFQAIHAQTGVTILLVTHASELGRYGTRSIQMAGGEIMAS
jgi:ABC-type lipoprotein export system ATPase subunit